MTFKTSIRRSAEIEAASKEEAHLTSGITHPGLHDCLCGRGGHATNHPGNVHFRTMVNEYKDYYMGLSRYGKLQVAAEVVRKWRSQDPPGRFLTMTDPSKREHSAWHDIGDKEAIKKTSQCLRERIPAHQKARTLEMVYSKAKDSKDQRSSQETASTTEPSRKERRDSSSCSMDVETCEWDNTRPQRTLQDEFEPRPILEGMTVTIVSPPETPATQTVLTSQANQLDSEMVVPVLTGQRINEKSSYGVQQRNGSPGHSNSRSRHHSRVESWAPSLSSVEELSLMESIMNDEAQQCSFQSANAIFFSGNEDSNGDNRVDTTLIPSAANLTRDVFDDDTYKPLPVSGKTNWFGENEPYHYQQPQQTTLTQAIATSMDSDLYL